MKIYSNKDGEFNELDEISFSINNVEELVSLKNFLEECIKNIDDINFSHQHLSDYIRNTEYDMPEIIICK